MESAVDFVELVLRIPPNTRRKVLIPSCTLCGDLKEQLLLARSMAGDSNESFHETNVVIMHNGQVVGDETTIASLASSQTDIVLDVTLGGDSTDSEIDIGRLTRQLRAQVAREDVPQAKERHRIRQRKKQSATAVAEAWARTHRHHKSQFVGEPILEEELASTALDSGVFLELRSSCGEIITLMGSHRTAQLEDAVTTFADALLSVVGVIVGEPEIEVGELIADSVSLHEAIGARNGEQLFHSILWSIRTRNRQNIKRVPGEGLCENLSDAILEDRADQIVGCIEDLIWDFSTKFDSPHSSPDSPTSLLPTPSGKANLSPEVLQWAQGLRPKDRIKF